MFIFVAQNYVDVQMITFKKKKKKNFLLGQGIYRSKYNISKGKTKLYNEYGITLIKLSINNN